MLNFTPKVDYLSKKEFIERTASLEGEHWTQLLRDQRWDYHEHAIRILRKKIRPIYPETVLEIGTVGINLVKGSHTLDFSEFDGGWSFPGNNPEIFHDARTVPWPIASKEYEVVVALRVFQHLAPNQKGAFLEALRVAHHVILVVPETYMNPVLPSAEGISYSQFVEFLGGIHPNYAKRTQFGEIYHWDTRRPSRVFAD